MKEAGTILPNKESLACSDSYRAALDDQKRVIGLAMSGYVVKEVTVCGEIQYFESDTLFYIVGRDLQIKYYERREDGDYRTDKGYIQRGGATK